MKLISHRCNTLEELNATPVKYGVEVDIRSFGTQLIINHEPFEAGELFEDWLSSYQHGTLILNVKEEGLESRLISLMKKNGINDYFFLDQSFPFLVKCANHDEHRCAVRVSEFESIETALSLAGQVDWVWVDNFTCFPLSQVEGKLLKKMGFKLCLVSPELHGKDAEVEIPLFAKMLDVRGIIADAICTKRPDIWEKMRFCS